MSQQQVTTIKFKNKVYVVKRELNFLEMFKLIKILNQITKLEMPSSDPSNISQAEAGQALSLWNDYGIIVADALNQTLGLGMQDLAQFTIQDINELLDILGERSYGNLGAGA